MLSLFNKKGSRKPKHKYGARGVSRPWASYNPRKALWNPSDPYSDSFVHKFRRFGQLMRLSTDATSTIIIQEDASPTAQFTLGPASSDGLGGLNIQQFGMTMTSQMSSVLNYTDFVSLFNEYRLDKIDLRIDLLNGPSGQPNVASVQPTMYVRYDPNDAVMPANFADLAQSANTTQFNFSQKTSHHYSFVPKGSALYYTPIGAGGVGYGAPSYNSVWFDMSNAGNTIPMYGLKIWTRNMEAVAGTGQIFQFQPTYFFSVRRPH